MTEPRVDPALLAIVRTAARALSDEWRLEIAPGATSAAVEVRLVVQRRLGGRTRFRDGPVFAAYRRFADLVFEAQRLLHPELDGQLAWGGNFTTADGRWQVGRFVLGQFRGRGSYRRPQDRVLPSQKSPAASRDEGKALAEG